MGGPVDDPFTGSPKIVAQGVAEESGSSTGPTITL